jgi:hypothetical protein
MATLNDAKTAWQRQKRRFRENTPTRTAYLGNGMGYATSNIVVADNPSLFYAREKMTDKQYFVVPNFNAGINPQFNLPVVLGYDQINPNIEQILGIDMSIFPYQSSASVLGGLGPHHKQHEFGGGDEVFIDPELIKIGLFTPEYPPTFQGWVQPFYYSHKTGGLRVFGGSRIEDVSQYKPTASGVTKFLSISFNPDSGSLVYRQGTDLTPVTTGSATLEELLAGGGSYTVSGGTAQFPTVPGGEIPIATFALTSTTASLNWSATNSSYYHTRLFLGKIDTDIYARLDSLERNSTINTLPTTGAAKYPSVINRNVHDGDLRIGRINDKQLTGTSSPSWGNKLYFSGALGTQSWNSENSDPLWLARYNAGNNMSYLRMSIGDDPSNASATDSFQIGTTDLPGVYTPAFYFNSDGTTNAGGIKAVAYKIADYTATSADNVIVCDSAGSITITLPVAIGKGKEFNVKSLGTGTTWIDGNAAETIDGAASVAVYQYDSITVVDYTAGSWVII